MRVNNNISSLNAWRNLSATDTAMGKSLERLSSGYRINRAGDDVAGLAISENMRAQIRGLNQAVSNAQDGISLLQTGEGSLNEVHSMLHRMRELSVQSANGTLQPEDRKPIQSEMDNLAKEVTRITNATQFNGKDLIDGSLQNAGATGTPNSGGIDQISLQIGPNAGQNVAFEIGALDAQSLGIGRNVMTASVYVDTDATAAFKFESGHNFISGVAGTGAVAAGVAAGDYEVKYDHQAKTVQLFDSAGKAIGNVQSMLDQSGNLLSEVTIGEKTTAQEITIQLDKTAIAALTGNNSDFLTVGSRVGTVVAGGVGINNDTAAGKSAILEVGWALQDGKTYNIDTTATTAQLLDGTSTIGPVATNAAGTVTVGDVATGRYIRFTSDAAAGTFQVKVNNNGQAAENAKFTGGVKYGSSQVFAGLNVSSAKGAEAAITAIDGAIAKVSSQRSQMGAVQNRLEHTINNLQVVSENLTASESRIRDVDMALEMATFTKHQILMQSGTAMLAQANQKNQSVLSLLR